MKMLHGMVKSIAMVEFKAKEHLSGQMDRAIQVRYITTSLRVKEFRYGPTDAFMKESIETANWKDKVKLLGQMGERIQDLILLGRSTVRVCIHGLMEESGTATG